MPVPETGSFPQKSEMDARLLSIFHDSTIFLRKTIEFYQGHKENDGDEHRKKISRPLSDNEETHLRWPVVANERCGSWYAYPYTTASSVHFKSTDGHRNIYNFSLKRMNLRFLNTVAEASRRHGCALIVDASKYKIQPDSFSATLPIWCAVMNGLVSHYKRCLGFIPDEPLDEYVHDQWDEHNALFTPTCISEEYHEQMKGIIQDRVTSAIEAKVILDPRNFVSILEKPMRCFWIQNQSGDSHHEANLRQLYDDIESAQSKYSCILCISCSNVERTSSRCGDEDEGEANTETGECYISGAGDDEESWAKGLTPSLFWNNVDELMHAAKTMPRDKCKLEEVIKDKVREAREGNEEWFRAPQDRILSTNSIPVDVGTIYKNTPKPRPPFTSYFDTIGASGNGVGSISVGTRRSGRPPECWEHFDAIINVTTMEYDELSSGSGIPDKKFYLQLPVKEGKRDRTELEKWLPVSMLFIIVNIVNGNNVLIHCAQGQDRSVAITMASLCIFYQFINGEDENSGNNIMNLHPWSSDVSYESFSKFCMTGLEEETDTSCVMNGDESYLLSGIPSRIVNFLCEGRDGKKAIFSYLRSKLNHDHGSEEEFVFATKDTLRLALIKIQQYRPKACPTRSTMQKLNRFFMSTDSMYDK